MTPFQTHYHESHSTRNVTQSHGPKPLASECVESEHILSTWRMPELCISAGSSRLAYQGGIDIVSDIISQTSFQGYHIKYIIPRYHTTDVLSIKENQSISMIMYYIMTTIDNTKLPSDTNCNMWHRVYYWIFEFEFIYWYIYIRP